MLLARTLGYIQKHSILGIELRDPRASIQRRLRLLARLGKDLRGQMCTLKKSSRFMALPGLPIMPYTPYME